MKCSICGKRIDHPGEMALRTSWIEAGGWDDFIDDIPGTAIAHDFCNAQEKQDLQAGKIHLSDIWIREPKVIWTLIAKR
jgi:hypothetical protein